MKESLKDIVRLLLHVRDWMLFAVHYPISVARFKALHRPLSPQQRFDVPDKFRGVGEFSHINAKQILYEIKELFRTVSERKPKVVLEIGTYRGGTLYLWCQAAASDALVISLDLPLGGWTHPFSYRRRLFYRHFVQTGQQQLHMLSADSHQQATLEKIKKILNGRTVDFLFIDGDHSYEGVKKDFEMYAPLVTKGGLIGFHDIQVRPQHPHTQVYQLWRELRRKYSSREIIATEGTELANIVGIGLICWPSEQPVHS